MMLRIKIIVLLFAILLISSGGYAQSAPVFDWQKSIGGTSADQATKIIPSNNGGYILIGSTRSNNGDVTTFNHGSYDVWVIQMDALGNISWAKTFGGMNSDNGVSAVQLPSGKIFVVANTSSNNGDVTMNHGSQDVWVLSLDTAGNILWKHTYGGSDDDVACTILKTSDNNLLIGATTKSENFDVTNNNGEQDFWLLKIDTMGAMLWEKSLGGSSDDVCYSTIQSSDGGFVSTGASNSNNGDLTFNHGEYDYWVVKTDALGNLLWQHSLGGTDNEAALSLIQNTSGDFIIAGYSNSSNGDVLDHRGASDYWIIDLTNAGNMVNAVSYGGNNSDIPYSIIQTDDGGYLIAGETASRDIDVDSALCQGSFDYWLVKTDAGSNLLWNKTYGGTLVDQATSVIQTADLGFALVGYSNSNNGNVSGHHGGSNQNDIWMMKMSCLSPVVSFSSSVDTVCNHFPVNFTNVSVNSAFYQWQIDGFNSSTAQNFSFNPGITGTYEISLIGYTCFETDTMTMEVTIVDAPIPLVSASANYLCSGDSVTLATDTAQSYLWSNGANTQNITVFSGGNYFVTTSEQGCIGASDTLAISQYTSPVVELGADTIFCQGAWFVLTVPDGYQSYLWSDGSTNDTLEVYLPGNYSVTVADGFCITTDSINLRTDSTCAFPIAGFTVNDVDICEGFCINYTDASLNATAWNWSFPGGNITSSNAQNPVVCYNTSGTYSAQLIVSNSFGSNAFNLIQGITVNPNPQQPVLWQSGDTLFCSGAGAYQWYYNGAAITGAVLSHYVAEFDGYYYATSTSAFNCSSASDSAYFMFTGIISLTKENFTVIPNPSTRLFNLNFGNGFSSAEICVTDVSGKLIFTEHICQSASSSFTIDLSDVAEGIYFIRIADDAHVYNEKLIVNR